MEGLGPLKQTSKRGNDNDKVKELEDDEEGAALQRGPQAAAKGKGKAQRQRMAGKQPTRNDNGGDNISLGLVELEGLELELELELESEFDNSDGYNLLSAILETGLDWNSIAILETDGLLDADDYNYE